MALNRDQHRALRLLADAPNGATATIMLARGFTISLLDDLVLRGLATAEKRATRVGRRASRTTKQFARRGTDDVNKSRTLYIKRPSDRKGLSGAPALRPAARIGRETPATRMPTGSSLAGC
jgi:hypothetical protein